jgi:hypothetical protein
MAEPLLPGGIDCHGQGPVYAATPHRVKDCLRSPARPGSDELQHQMVPVWKGASGRLFLTLQKIDQLFRCLGIQTVHLLQGFLKIRIFQASVSFFEKLSDPFRKVKVTIILFAFPEGGSRCLRVTWQHKYVVMGNSMNPPVLGTESEYITYPCLPDKLFVEITDPGIGLLMAEMKVAAVGYDSAGKIERLKGSSSGGHRVIKAVDGTKASTLESGWLNNGRQHLKDQIEPLAARCR